MKCSVLAGVFMQRKFLIQILEMDRTSPIPSILGLGYHSQCSDTIYLFLSFLVLSRPQYYSTRFYTNKERTRSNCHCLDGLLQHQLQILTHFLDSWLALGFLLAPLVPATRSTHFYQQIALMFSLTRETRPPTVKAKNIFVSSSVLSQFSRVGSGFTVWQKTYCSNYSRLGN